jgi:hypothetical protein
MLKDIVAVAPLDHFRLKLLFEDGVEGVVDVSQCVPLRAFLLRYRTPRSLQPSM